MKRGGYDVLYHYQDQILEVSRSNFFIVRDEVLITPTNNVLHGVTRKTILELAEQEMKIEMRDIHKDELALADEAFLTGTTKRIMPVIRVDDLIIGKGSPGKWTKVLMNVFAEYEKKVSAEKV
jgi:branched-subunit amino acid aminotransferase/4-amino-4-deoxychorismate lyase